eukprot:14672856-Alexandrium_andersonii.AAC.1
MALAAEGASAAGPSLPAGGARRSGRSAGASGETDASGPDARGTSTSDPEATARRVMASPGPG